MAKSMNRLELKGLEIAPSQQYGAFRLAPLLRREERGDLRLAKTLYRESEAVVSLNDGTEYWSYVPHGLILSWTANGSPVASFGTSLDKKDGRSLGRQESEIRLIPRMAHRLSGNRLRFLPLHMAMEGFLAMSFGGPDIAWTEYSRQALRDGLSPRWESAVPGSDLVGFEDALRMFEIHDRQVGVLVFVADALTSAFVVPTHRDYRALHTTLLEDFYCDLIYQYALLYSNSTPFTFSIPDDEIRSLADISKAVGAMRESWRSFHLSQVRSENLMERDLWQENVYGAGPFRHQRFVTDLDPELVNHIGEVIYRDDGTVEYLKSFRLSGAQTRRAHLLDRFAKNEWHIGQTAESFGQEPYEFTIRLKNAGFGYLIAQHVTDAAVSKERKERSGANCEVLENQRSCHARKLPRVISTRARRLVLP